MKLINENQCILRREESVNHLLGKNRSAKALMLRLDITCDREPSPLGEVSINVLKPGLQFNKNEFNCFTTSK